MPADGAYPDVRMFLQGESHNLRIVAARTRLAEGELREIVEDGKEISDEVAKAIILLTISS